VKAELAKPPLPTAKRKVPFMTRVEGAKEVLLTGDFIEWTEAGIRLVGAENQEWNAVLNLSPGEYRYRLLVDGRWEDDPEATRRVPNPFGTMDCVLVVP